MANQPPIPDNIQSAKNMVKLYMATMTNSREIPNIKRIVKNYVKSGFKMNDMFKHLQPYYAAANEYPMTESNYGNIERMKNIQHGKNTVYGYMNTMNMNDIPDINNIAQKFSEMGYNANNTRKALQPYYNSVKNNRTNLNIRRGKRIVDRYMKIMRMKDRPDIKTIVEKFSKMGHNANNTRRTLQPYYNSIRGGKYTQRKRPKNKK